MNVWERYDSRIRAGGSTPREKAYINECNFLNAKLPGSLSYHKAIINGEERELAIINSDNFDMKTLCTLPGETLPHGGLVYWSGNYWLITEIDVNTEVYARGKMRQCNYLLRFISNDKQIIERWCIIDDGTRYLSGEYGDREMIMLRGDSRISMTIAKDEYTSQFGRENRFIIDDYDSKNVLAYRMTKPYKLGGTYGANGVYYFVLTECNTEDDDNLELHIADYYQYFPRESDLMEGTNTEVPGLDIIKTEEKQEERKVWI